MTLLNDSWIGQHPIWQVEGRSKEVYKMEDFYRRRACQESYEQKKKTVSAKTTYFFFFWHNSIHYFSQDHF